jgi:hypothetical protein
LYVAIVAIWAVVLMPRWLRTRSSDSDSSDAEDTLAPAAEPIDDDERSGPRVVEWVDDESPWREGPVWDSLSEPGEFTVARADGTDWHEARTERDTDADESTARPAPPPGKPAARPAPRPLTTADRHARTVRARRRMLGTLVLLTVVAGGLAAVHLAALWVVVPPAGILGGFLLLLREAAHTDAERSRRQARAAQAQRRSRDATRAAAPAARVGTAQPSAPQAPSWEAISAHAEVHYLSAFRREPQPEPEPMAPVIQISKRIREGVYDQYADAAHRAVGD